MILDQYGAADIVVPEVELRRLYPGGPAIGTFTARFGPDGQVLGRFRLRAADSAQLPRMPDEGVRRMDQIYTRALEAGLLQQPDPGDHRARGPRGDRGGGGRRVPGRDRDPGADRHAVQPFNIQVETPDPDAVRRAELSVSRVNGVTSAITTSPALGSTSVMRVTCTGDAGALQAALRSQGWRVEVVGGNARISR